MMIEVMLKRVGYITEGSNYQQTCDITKPR